LAAARPNYAGRQLSLMRAAAASKAGKDRLPQPKNTAADAVTCKGRANYLKPKET